MKIGVYGTLKKNSWNHHVLSTSKFIEDDVIEGYKLLDAGFPVARPSEGSSIKIEIYEVSDDTLSRLDRLEANGRMYHRTEVKEGLQIYVGDKDFWDREDLSDCHNEDGFYDWKKVY